jgi:hypothetical protein
VAWEKVLISNTNVTPNPPGNKTASARAMLIQIKMLEGDRTDLSVLTLALGRIAEQVGRTKGLKTAVRGHSPYLIPTHRNIIPIYRNIIPALRNTIPIYLPALYFLSFYGHSTSFPSLSSPFSIYIPL